MKKLSNISVKEFRAVLTLLELRKIRTKGGHEAWMKAGMTRPVIIQTHVNPMPELVVQNCLRNIGIKKEEFIALLEKSK